MNKIKKLFKEPYELIPFIKSKLFPVQRKAYEFFGSSKYSKPYIGNNKLLEYLNKKNGFFVQCGGNDGYSSDPTYYLERIMGWNGIITEPLPIYKLCQKNRPGSIVVQSACVSFDYQKDTIDFIACNAMSFIKGSIPNSDEWIKGGEESQKIKSKEIKVPAQTIQSIIDRYSVNNKKIDLFVADVEGYELEVIRGLNIKKNPPAYFLLEARDPSKLTEFLIKNSYEYICEIDTNNHLYKKCILK